VRLDEGVFHVRLGGDGPGYGDGPATRPDACLTLDADTCVALGSGALTLADGVRAGQVTVEGDAALVGV
jgi:hypothetical protein